MDAELATSSEGTDAIGRSMLCSITGISAFFTGPSRVMELTLHALSGNTGMSSTMSTGSHSAYRQRAGT